MLLRDLSKDPCVFQKATIDVTIRIILHFLTDLNNLFIKFYTETILQGMLDILSTFLIRAFYHSA